MDGHDAATAQHRRGGTSDHQGRAARSGRPKRALLQTGPLHRWHGKSTCHSGDLKHLPLPAECFGVQLRAAGAEAWRETARWGGGPWAGQAAPALQAGSARNWLHASGARHRVPLDQHGWPLQASWPPGSDGLPQRATANSPSKLYALARSGSVEAGSSMGGGPALLQARTACAAGQLRVRLTAGWPPAAPRPRLPGRRG